MTTRYLLRSIDKKKAAQLADELNLPRFIADLFVARGMSEAHQVTTFLNATLESDWFNPYELPGMSEVVERLDGAIRAHEHILVFGDFDLDGISATTVLSRGLRELGAQVTPFIPLRFEEGYGLSEKAIERLAAYNPDVVVTVDCGIASKHEVPALQAKGIDVLITDHHEPLDLVPEGVPILDPKLDKKSPSIILAGVGVALKLVQALGGRFGFPHLWREYLDFAALGTIADLMPMRNENRVLVAEGLRLINNEPRPCVRALIETCRKDIGKIDSTNIAYTLVPRLNAAGRMGEPDVALQLLMTDDYEQAVQLAKRLDELNTNRRTIEAELAVCAEEQVQQNYSPDDRVILVYGEDWHEGVKGIVASRLVGKYRVPCLLCTIDKGEARGSGRTVGDINLLAAVESASEHLNRFGGHHAAVGINLPAENLPAFKESLKAYMKALPESAFFSRVMIDTIPSLEELTLPNVSLLESFEPFGQEFLAPVFALQHVWITNARAVGKNANHLSFVLTDGRFELSAIMFNCPNIERFQCNHCLVNTVFSLAVDEWMGRKTVKAMVCSLETVAPCGALQGFLNEKERAFLCSFDRLEDDEGLPATEASLRSDKETAQADEADISAASQLSSNQRAAALRQRWVHALTNNPECARELIVRELIGAGTLHPSQTAVLDNLDKHHSTLAVMATGRGKSLLFYEHAIKRALMDNKISIFVYPLRALLADQSYHLSSLLVSFGLSAVVLCGVTPVQKRNLIFEEIAKGQHQIILTTPEFLGLYANRFQHAGDVGFIAIDEAHHLLNAAGSGREGYAQLGKVVSRFKNCDVLALSATVPNDAFVRIIRDLSISSCVFDATSRPNLLVSDMRGIKNKHDYIAHEISDGKKSLIFVNSRESCVMLTRKLRHLVPHIAPYIGFYHGGMSREKRNYIEDLFRRGVLCTLVVTSAFGEGVNIPDIHRVLLFHMPYNEIEFNQVSGRAGRNGSEAVVHVLFSKQDTHLNTSILKAGTPQRDALVCVYKALRSLKAQADKATEGEHTDSFAVTIEDVVRLVSEQDSSISHELVIPALSIFYELGLLKVGRIASRDRKGDSVKGTYDTFLITMPENPSRVNLSDSARYCEGLQEYDRFITFSKWVAECSIADLQNRISHPLLPEDMTKQWGIPIVCFEDSTDAS